MCQSLDGNEGTSIPGCAPRIVFEGRVLIVADTLPHALWQVSAFLHQFLESAKKTSATLPVRLSPEGGNDLFGSDMDKLKEVTLDAAENLFGSVTAFRDCVAEWGVSVRVMEEHSVFSSTVPSTKRPGPRVFLHHPHTHQPLRDAVTKSRNATGDEACRGNQSLPQLVRVATE